jgi:hypothetical protein
MPPPAAVEGQASESVAATIARVTEPLVEALLMVNEATLTGPLTGTSDFADSFAAAGPFDARGRSLRQLDLSRRLLQYPCSYLIYSDSFDSLPVPAKAHVYRRLGEVLRGEDRSPRFDHLSAEDRGAILEILTDTKPDFAARGRLLELAGPQAPGPDQARDLAVDNKEFNRRGVGGNEELGC